MGWLHGWQRRQKITIDHSKIEDNLVNFPIKVILPSDSPVFNYAKSDGSDARFTADDGVTLLSFECEVFSKTEKIAIYHVKIPFVSANTDTFFYIYYGNPSASNSSQPASVWSDYEMVLHMAETLQDSTSKHAITNVGTSAILLNDEYFRSFDGVNDYISIGTTSDYAVGSGPVTFEVFFKANSIPNTSDPNIGGRFVTFQDVTNSSSKIGFGLYGDGTQKLMAFLDSGSANNVLKASVTYLDSNTHHAVLICNNGSASLYFDGGLVTSASYGLKTDDPACPALIGVYETATPKGMFDGLIGFVAISKTVRSAAWIKATNYSLKNQLLCFGEEEFSGLGLVAYFTCKTECNL